MVGGSNPSAATISGQGESRLSMITLDDVKAAAERIKGAVERTPCLRSRTLSERLGAEIFLKFENLQFTASFKERGALNKLLSLDANERKRGVVAMSAGNHAQGVAYHANRLGIPATIVMPEGTPFVKVKNTKAHGADVVSRGTNITEAFEHAKELERQSGLVFVHPYDDALIMAGQGTVAMEMLEDHPELDCLIVPIGGGGLISGCAVAAKAMKPSIEVYGAEAELYPAMRNALMGETKPIGGQTIAEGVAVRDMGKRTVEVVKKLVKDIILVPEEMIETAIVLLLSIEKTVVEGAGAAGLGALLHKNEMFKGRKVGIPLCGGNIDPRLLSTIILRELAREGRIINFAVELEDRPGLLAKIAQVVGEAQGNILEVSHNRMLSHMSARAAELRLSVEARDQTHANEILAKVRAAGFKVRVMGPLS